MKNDQKEILGKLFKGYINIKGNPQSEYRNEAAIEMSKALEELEAMGVSFEAIAAEDGIKELLMLTDGGMEEFIAFVRGFMSCGYDDGQDMSDIVDEQIRIAKWVNEHRKELIV